MAISAEYRSKFASLHRQWWRLRMSEKFSSGRKTADKQIRSFPREKGDNYYQLLEGSNTRTSQG